MVDEIEDTAGETAQKVTRVAMTAASMLAEQIARQRQQQAQRVADAEGAEAARLQARWDAQKAAAHAEFGTASHEWFDRASPRETADMWQSAKVWVGVEPEEFGRDEARIRAEIERRHDIDLVDVDREGRELADELRELADAQRRRERESDRAATADEFEAGAMVAGAGQDAALDRAESARREAARSVAMANDLDTQTDGVEYDSDARRAALAARARAGGADVETVDARVKAANANGRPSRQAAARRKKVAAPSRAPVQVWKGAQIER